MARAGVWIALAAAVAIEPAGCTDFGGDVPTFADAASSGTDAPANGAGDGSGSSYDATTTGDVGGMVAPGADTGPNADTNVIGTGAADSGGTGASSSGGSGGSSGGGSSSGGSSGSGGDDGGGDAGADTGAPDSGTPDTGALDTAAPDAIADTGGSDARDSGADTGGLDAGDAGAQDSGAADADASWHDGATDTGAADGAGLDGSLDGATDGGGPGCDPDPVAGATTHTCMAAQNRPNPPGATDLPCVDCATANNCFDPAQAGGNCELSGNATLFSGTLPDGKTCAQVFSTLVAPITERQVCLYVLGGVFSSQCAATMQETPCLCGATDPGMCSAGTVTPTGPLYDAYACDFNSTNGATVTTDFVLPQFGAGMANSMVQCVAAFGCKCFGP